MKRFQNILMPLIVILIITAVSSPGYAVTDKIVLHIEGMTWAAWPLIIKKALEGLDGVEKAKISYKTKKGEVFFDPDKVSETDIINKVNQIGFRAKVMKEQT